MGGGWKIQGFMVDKCLTLFGFEFPADFHLWFCGIYEKWFCMLTEFSVKIKGTVLKTEKGWIFIAISIKIAASEMLYFFKPS